MKYTKYDMNAYNLHIINTDKFKTIMVGVAFRRKIKKDEITIRNLLKELMVNATYNFPSEKSLIIETENLYDLKLSSQNYRVGNYAIMTFKMRFLNEKFTEDGMNEESIRFLLDLIFNPKLDIDIDKCKERLRKSILSLSDNKVKYSLFKLLETTGDMPYAYNSYGYIDEIDKITYEDLQKYYDSIIKNDMVDVYVVGEVDEAKIKNIFRENFKVTTYHKQEIDVIAKELSPVSKIKEYREVDNVNQTQLAIFCNINGLTDRERKYVLPVYSEMLGGSANSILFDDVREKNSYAYYVNSVVKSYDNMLLIYAGIGKGNEKNVLKLIDKSLKNITKNKFDEDKFKNAKETIISAIKASLDNPMSIISSYYAKELVNSPDIEERIKNMGSVTREEIVNVSKKIKMHTVFILEDSNEKDNNKED